MGGDNDHRSQPLDGSEPVVSLEDIPLHSTNLLSLLDKDGIIRYQSPAIARLCGFDQDELVGISCADVFHPDDHDRVYDAFKNVVASEEFIIEAVEYRHLTADGSYVWVESVASSNPTPDGHYVINTRDISEKKAQQKELEHANERLESFARIVSHDLRNPLGVAQGYLQLAETESPSDHHATVATALDRMETLIESLLSDARGDTDGPTVELVDLTRLSERCWQHIVHEEARLRTDVDRPIYADPLQLTQLFENLFRNAIEHGRADAVVTVGGLEDGFYVEDNGTGVPEAERDRIVERGYSTAPDGTGLGLAIVQRVAESHGWGLGVTEGETGGARFELTGVEFAA
ncbi:two-component system sensor histidine kinase NtrB [Halohasta salina]|uniref:two-component system sensor histidine kinase NtrB n=1 Tax=Halohasta salina TaxID=2961621 RepID=UPI0020A5692E|nr:PAS domain-containing sensor histidine kinase [Halohasta salina]